MTTYRKYPDFVTHHVDWRNDGRIVPYVRFKIQRLEFFWWCDTKHKNLLECEADALLAEFEKLGDTIHHPKPPKYKPLVYNSPEYQKVLSSILTPPPSP